VAQGGGVSALLENPVASWRFSAAGKPGRCANSVMRVLAEYLNKPLLIFQFSRKLVFWHGIDITPQTREPMPAER
jgi:hypothetical protein